MSCPFKVGDRVYRKGAWYGSDRGAVLRVFSEPFDGCIVLMDEGYRFNVDVDALSRLCRACDAELEQHVGPAKQCLFGPTVFT